MLDSRTMQMAISQENRNKEVKKTKALSEGRISIGGSCSETTGCHPTV